MQVSVFKKFWLIYLVVSTIIFLLRIIIFSSSYGGIEHDSGWYLGVAKNLARNGIYASYTNTIREEGVGDRPSIHGRFSVQDKDGFSYFPAGVTVGPGYVVPQAILLKIFGNGWWQYRLWPILTYTGLIFVLFYLTFRIGGLLSLIILQFWLWAIPQLTIQNAYESYSEHTALFYLLLSFIFYNFIVRYKRKFWLFVIPGLFLSFSVLTKTLFFLSGSSFLLIALLDVLIYRKKIKLLILKWPIFLTGFILPIVLFEGYKYLFLISNFNYASWVAVNEDFKLTFQSSGSGINNLNFGNLDWPFILKKFNIWSNVGVSYFLIIWSVLLIFPLVLIKFVSKKFKEIALLLYMTMIISFFWFIFVSTFGWARHIWQGIVLGMLLTSICFGLGIKKFSDWKKKELEVTFSLVLILLICGFILNVLIYQGQDFRLFLNSESIEKWQKTRYVSGIQGFPSNPILSFKDQKDLISFFNENVNNEDRIYYAGWFLNAEVSPLVDKVFYTLDRYFTLNQKNPNGGRSFLILGPYQQGQWSFEPPEYVPNKISELCINVVFKNPSYILCELKTGLVYNNPAY